MKTLLNQTTSIKTILNKELIEKFQSFDKEQLNEELMAFCQEGNLEVVQYLMSSPDLKEHPDIHYDNDYAFKRALMGEYLDIVKYFIFECNFKKTETIQNLLSVLPKDLSDKTNQMFDIRDFNVSLEKDLNSDKIAQKKLKI